MQVAQMIQQFVRDEEVRTQRDRDPNRYQAVRDAPRANVSPHCHSQQDCEGDELPG